MRFFSLSRCSGIEHLLDRATWKFLGGALDWIIKLVCTQRENILM